MKFELRLEPHEISAMNGLTLRRWLCQLLDCSKHKPSGFRLIVVEPDEPMKVPMPRVDLTKPIKPGFRRPVSLPIDEPVDKRDDGSFAALEIVQGDSTGKVRESSTENQIDLYLNGDGSLGDKVVRVTVDGHVGPGEVPVTLDIGYTVAHPDATAFGAIVEGEDEAIPAT